GIVFNVSTDGTAFTTLYSFTNCSDGGTPYAGLFLSVSTLYGITTYGGGSSQSGTVFAVNTDGTGFMTLHSFTGTSGALLANSDGANPYGRMLLSCNTLYGTAAGGGSWGLGAAVGGKTEGPGFIRQHDVWDHPCWRQFERWRGVQRQHRWHGFYDPI